MIHSLSIIPYLPKEADRDEVLSWLRQVVSAIGGGYNPDTPPEDYIVRSTGEPTLSKIECWRLSIGQDRAIEILGYEEFESYTLELVMREVGWRYHATEPEMVPMTKAWDFWHFNETLIRLRNLKKKILFFLTKTLNPLSHIPR